MTEIEKIIRDLITSALGDLDLPPTNFTVEHPVDLSRGDYATNVALVLAKINHQPANEIAEKIIQQIIKVAPLDPLKVRPWLERIEVAPPGFINFFLSRDFFVVELKRILDQGEKYGTGVAEAGKKVMIEYTDPNPFKEFHLGHLMSNTIGEAISRLIASQGTEVKRACYQGDVGMHVAKAIYGSLRFKVKNKKETKEIKEWGQAYAIGAQSYEEDQTAKKEINELNKKIYDRSDEETNKLYDAGKRASLDYFEIIYKRLGTKFDFYFFESASGSVGQKLTLDNLGKIFEKSEGAVIFSGGKHNLHTRVFLNSEGLPTYEAKELGLAKLKFERYPYDESVVITGNEVASYFTVLKKVLELIFPDLARKTKHLPHGMLRLPSGKMSSRTGTVITAENLLAEIKSAVSQKIAERGFSAAERETVTEAVAIAAIKYSILKQSPGRDSIFDLAKSLSLEGDSGPYLQYAYVRARAVLEKAVAENVPVSFEQPLTEISELERRLARFPEIVARAAAFYAPNLLVTYLTELASSFNGYYATKKIVNPTDPYSPYRLATTVAFSNIMKSGLTLLAVPVLERM